MRQMPTFTLHWNPSCSTLMTSIMSDGKSYSLRSFHKLSQCTLSKAFSKSTKLRYKEDCNSIDCSPTFYRCCSHHLCSNLFLSSSLKASSTSACFSLYTANFLRPCTFFTVLSFSWNRAHRRMWSLFTSAPLYVRTSITDLLHLLLITM
jgi:hypothetical protein